jgi:predicted short-subunit dehydrogenase-like oxidoreductase (DUF2520 family)
LQVLLGELGWEVVLLGREQFPRESALAAVLIVVPDHAIPSVAQRLVGYVPSGTPVLHTSGAVELTALNSLADAGCSVGGLHPLVAVPNRADGARLLRGAWWGIEGEGTARKLAESIVESTGGRTLPIPRDGRALYHAAAVLVSNGLVALLAAAETLMSQAGVPVQQARSALTELAAGALAAVRVTGPVAALTGPVARGDVETVRVHLARLSGHERDVYCALGRGALALARQRGLDPGAAAALATLLGETA